VVKNICSGGKKVSKEVGEAVALMVKGIGILEKLEGMSMSEKRKWKRESESEKEYVERIRGINEKAVVVAIKRIVEG